MELLASDMITRALVLVSRRNFPQALKIMSETRRILHTVLATVSKTLPPQNGNNESGMTARNRKEVLTLTAVRSMQAILQDLGILVEALEDNVDLFAHDHRNVGAQQVSIFFFPRFALLLMVWLGYDSTRPEELDRPKCNRASFLDCGSLYRTCIEEH